MEELVQTRSDLSLTFEGQSTIDAEVLMDALGGAIKAYKASLSSIYEGQGVEVGIDIKAFAPGSFEVVMQSVVSALPAIAPQIPSVVESAKHFLEIIKLKKELKGLKPAAVETVGEKTKIVNNEGETNYYNSTVYNIYANNPSIDASLSRMFNALNGSERPAVAFSIPENRIQIEEDNYQDMCASVVDDLRDAEYQKLETIIEDNFLLKSADFLGNSQWSFYLDNKIIRASIEDDTFMESVKKGRVKLSAGVRIPARMRIEALYDNKINLIRKNYTILQITGELIEPTEEDRQIILEEFANDAVE